MIAPAEFAASVDRLRFLVSPVGDNQRQLLVVEIAVTKRTASDFAVKFFVPTASLLQDEIGSVGDSLLNDAMDAWDLKESKANVCASASFEPCDAELTALSGCSLCATVRVPRGPCSVVASWSHALLPGGVLFLPTQNDCLQSWCAEMIVIGSPDDKHGMPPVRPLARSMRWDMVPPHLKFPSLNNTFLVKQWSSALPFYNLYFSLTKRAPGDRDYMGVSGARLRDETRFHVVSFCDVGFQTVPAVCGCYVRDGLNYEKAHIPLAITERVTRSEPIVFSDGAEGSGVVLFRVKGNSGAYRTMAIDYMQREEFGGVNWVTAKLLQ